MNVIKVEGYMAFHGTMKITPDNALYPPYYVMDKDWLYKPDTKCWYAGGSSYPEEICQIVEWHR